MNLQAIAIAALAAFLLGGIGGFRIEQIRWNHADDARELAEANAAVKSAEASEKVVTVYVDRIKEVDKPVPVVRERLVERVCTGSDPAVPNGAPAAPASAAPDAADRLAAELVASKQNAEQLAALIAWVKANTDER